MTTAGISSQCGASQHASCPGYYRTAHPCGCGCHTTPKSDRNDFEQRRRIDKAWKLAAILQEHGATPQGAAALPLKTRLDVARMVGVNPPSEKTWQLTVEYLANRLRATEHQAAELLEETR